MTVLVILSYKGLELILKMVLSCNNNVALVCKTVVERNEKYWLPPRRAAASTASDITEL